MNELDNKVVQDRTKPVGVEVVYDGPARDEEKRKRELERRASEAKTEVQAPQKA